MGIKSVLKYEDLLSIEEFLRENELDSGNLSIVMDIETQQRLNRINSDYFYKANPNGKLDACDVKDVTIQIGEVKFVYRLKEKSDDKDS